MKVGMLLFDKITLLDFFGPWEVFSRVPSWAIRVVACSDEIIQLPNGISMAPEEKLTKDSRFDIFVLPGGPGQIDFSECTENLRVIRSVCLNSKYVLSVCTGSLILGMCGLLKGKRAVTHWQYQDLLNLLGANPVNERIVEDGNIITCSGVSAGIDMALYVVRKIAGDNEAKIIQCATEYDPAPYFNLIQIRGESETQSLLTERTQSLYMKRKDQIDRLTGPKKR